MLEQAAWRALGTNAHLFVLDGDLAKARASVERLLADVDLAYSRFRSDSELMRLQASPTRSGPVSPLLWLAVTTALDVAHETGGAVDPTIGMAMRIIGYDDDFSRVVRNDAPIRVTLGPAPGWQSVRLDERTRTVRIPAGVELDLGSSGKALASDLAATAARCSRPGRWRPGQSRRRYRDLRSRSRGRLADPRQRGQRDRRGCAGRGRRHPVRSHGHLQHDGPPMERG